MFHAQMVEHSCENPIILRQAVCAELDSHPRAPHMRVGEVKLRLMYVPKS